MNICLEYILLRTELLESQLQQVKKNLKSVRSNKNSSPSTASSQQQLRDLEAREKLINDKIKDAKNDEEIKQLNTVVKSSVTYSCDKCFRIIKGMYVHMCTCICTYVYVYVHKYMSVA